MTRTDELKEEVQLVLKVFNDNERYLRQICEQKEYIKKLEAENRKLKYEYPDSKRKRDVALPYKWAKKGVHLLMFCPKCGMGIANWYRYCNACGQKIKQGNPLPEMEKRTEEEENG